MSLNQQQHLMKPVPAVCLVGPTASGKTNLAITLVQAGFPFEIISVDSALLYSGLDIGTAKPALMLRQTYPHHMIDILSPIETYDVQRFCQNVRTIALEIIERGKTPLLVGGTMMYFHALLKGLQALPSSDPAWTKRLEERIRQEGLPMLYQALKEVDTDSKIAPADRQRILRALNIYYQTGRPLSVWIKELPAPIPYIEAMPLFALCPDRRQCLHEAIEKRTVQMLEMGWIAETQALLIKLKEAQVDWRDSPLKCLGYAQIARMLLEDESLNIALLTDEIIHATKQLAKRQTTWLNQFPNHRRINWHWSSFQRLAYIRECLSL